jgi:hypothetical protein
VHQVGARAAELAGGIRVLEATLPRETVDRLVRVSRLGSVFRPDMPAGGAPLPAGERAGAGAPEPMFTPRASIAYRVDVRRFARQKRAALAAHRSQLVGGRVPARLRRYATRLPVPLFALLGGREWFNDPSGALAADFLDIFTD